MNPDKDPRADAKLQNLQPEELDVMWRFRNPEKGGERLTLEAIAVEVPLRFGFTISLSSLSQFYRWLKLKRRFAARTDTIEQIKLELAKDPNISAEQVEKAGQVLFMAEGIAEKDARVFANMVKIGQSRAKLAQNDKRLKQADKSLEMESRRVALLEKKAAKADQAAEVMSNGAMSTEEKQSRMKEIFGS